MLLVRTMLRASPVHGIGLFAAQDIAGGTMVWRFCDRFNILLTLRQFDFLREVQKTFVAHYGWIDQSDPKHWRVSLDDERFTNHSFAPNIASERTGEYANRACKDIACGEELLECYTDFYTPNKYQPFIDGLINQRALLKLHPQVETVGR